MRRTNRKALGRAKAMRTFATEAERRIWHLVRARRFEGYKFRRQVPIGPYIVDFVCLERRLIVEADGGQHATQLDYDNARDTYLRKRDYRVLRFWNNDILSNSEGVYLVIMEALRHPSPPLR